MAILPAADLLVCEGMYWDEICMRRGRKRAYGLFDSARLAKEAGVKALWLTHFSPALKDLKRISKTPERFFQIQLSVTMDEDDAVNTLLIITITEEVVL
jgi:ribonuclease Z